MMYPDRSGEIYLLFSVVILYFLVWLLICFFDLEVCKTNLQKPLAKQIMKVIPEPYEMDIVCGIIIGFLFPIVAV